MARGILSRFDLETDEYELCVKALGPSEPPGGAQENGLQIYLDGEAGRIIIDLDQAATRQLAARSGSPSACPSWRVSEADYDVAALGIGVDDAVGPCAHPMT